MCRRDSSSASLTWDTAIVLTHLNHTNPLVDPTSDAFQAVSDLGWTIARDGPTIDRDRSEQKDGGRSPPIREHLSSRTGSSTGQLIASAAAFSVRVSAV